MSDWVKLKLKSSQEAVLEFLFILLRYTLIIAIAILTTVG